MRSPTHARLAAQVRAQRKSLGDARERQAATSEILRLIAASPSDAQPVFEAIAAHAARLCDAEFSAVARYEGGLLHMVATRHMTPEEAAAYRTLFPRPPGRHFVIGRAFVDGQPAHVRDVRRDPDYDPHTLKVLQKAAPYRTYLGIPIMRDGVPIGAIGCGRRRVKPFTAPEIELVKTFADQAGIAIENVRLFQEREARNRDLSAALDRQTATADVLRVISQAQADLQAVFEVIADNATRLLGAWSTAVFRLEDGLIRIAAARGGLPGSSEARMVELSAPRAPSHDTPHGRAALTATLQHVADAATDPAWGPLVREAATLRGFRSVVAVPMARAGDVAGVIVVSRSHAGGFTPDEIALLQTFADQAVIAVENAGLLTELQARNASLTEALEQQTATSEMLRVISSSPTDVQPVFDAIAASASRLCGGVAAIVTRFDGELLHLVAHHNPRPGIEPVTTRLYPRPPGRDTTTGRAILERSIVHIADAERDPDLAANLARDVRAGSFLAVPMLRDGRPIGGISVSRVETGAFPSSQVELLRTFADQAVIATDNVQLFTQLQVRNGDLREALDQQTATSEVLKVISRSTFDLQPVLETLIENATRLAGAEGGVLTRLDGDAWRVVAAHGASPEYRDYWTRNVIRPDRGSAIGRAALERRVIHIADVLADPEWTVHEPQQIAGYRSVLGVPMLREDELIGLFFIWRTEVRPFSDKQIDLVATFADQAVIAIENARLLGELQARNASLTEALEQQTATSEILRVISRSPTDIQPVLDAMTASANRLCESLDASIWRLDGSRLLLVAHHGPIAIGSVGEFSLPLARGTVAGRTVLERRPHHVADVMAETEEFPEASENARRFGHRTLLSVPLMKDGAAIGALHLRRAEARPFTDRQVALLQTFADQAVIAMENVRLFTELGARNGELREALDQQTATADLLKVIGRSTFDLQPVFETLAENGLRLCEAEQAAIFRFDGRLLRIVTTRNLPPELMEFLEQHPIPLQRSSGSGRAGIERRTIHIHDVRTDSEYGYAGRDVAPYRTMLAIPMLRADELLGVIVIHRYEVRPFTAAQIALMETFADQAAIAIENAQLLSQLQTKNADLTEALEQQTATADILRVISSSPTDLTPVFESIARSAGRLCGGVMGGVFRYDGRLLHLGAMVNFGPAGEDTWRRRYPLAPTHDTATGRAILERGVAIVPDVDADPRAEWAREIARTGGYRSAMAVPMLREGNPIGVILVCRVEPGSFPANQVELLKTFAEQAVIAVQNVSLFTELQARNAELRVALEQQTATADILKVISSSPTDIQPVLDTVVESAARLCAGDDVSIFRRDGGRLVSVAHHGSLPHGRVGELALPLVSGTVNGRAVLEARTIHVDDLQAAGDEFPEGSAVARRFGHRTILSVPLLREGAAIGSLSIRRPEVLPFTEQEIALVRTFADQSVIAIENVRLFTELQTKNTELTQSLDQQTATSEILRVISSSPTDVTPVFEVIVANACRLCDGVFATAARLDGEMIHNMAHYGFTTEAVRLLRQRFPTPLSSASMSGRAILERTVVHSDDASTDPTLGVTHEISHVQGFRGMVSVPMLRGGQALGAIAVARREAGRFPDRQVELLRAFADRPSSRSRTFACSPSWRAATASCGWPWSSRRPPASCSR
jgi:GAF domain-containing protein